MSYERLSVCVLTYICRDIHLADGKMMAEMSGHKARVPARIRCLRRGHMRRLYCYSVSSLRCGYVDIHLVLTLTCVMGR